MMESDSIYSSTLVAVTIMYEVKKASNVAEHAKTINIQLSNEALQDYMEVNF